MCLLLHYRAGRLSRWHSGVAFDLALIDVSMPEIDGIHTAVEICTKLRNCKILLKSGDAASEPLLERAGQNGIDFDVLTCDCQNCFRELHKSSFRLMTHSTRRAFSSVLRKASGVTQR